MQFLRAFSRVDRAIAYTVIGRGWSVLSGPMTLLLIARFLSAEEQGFFYTFSSVLGLQVLFELGLSFVIFQFASHEKAKLNWTAEGELEGDEAAKARIFSLLRKALIWYAVLAGLVLVTMVPGGLLFFTRFQGPHGHVMWQLPWVWVVAATAANLLSSPLVAVLEGGGLVAEVALVRAGQLIVGSLLTWSALALHGQLWAAPMLNTVICLGWWGWLLTSKGRFLRQAFSVDSHAAEIDWRREVWPFQWKIALSGISSYFIFLLFTPVLFMFQGAVVAGQMGMSMAVMNAVATIAVAWVSTKMSPFGVLIAQGDFKRLDELFFPAMWKSIGVLVVLGGSFCLAVFGLVAARHPFGQRLLPPLPLLVFFGTTIINHVVGLQALYLRAHKEEPFLVLSVIVALLTGSSTYLLGKSSSVMAMLIGNFLITLLFSLGWGTYIFVKKRHAWHGDPAPLTSIP